MKFADICHRYKWRTRTVSLRFYFSFNLSLRTRQDDLERVVDKHHLMRFSSALEAPPHSISLSGITGRSGRKVQCSTLYPSPGDLQLTLRSSCSATLVIRPSRCRHDLCPSTSPLCPRPSLSIEQFVIVFLDDKKYFTLF